MNRTAVFENNLTDYETWFDRHPHVFQSEVEAIRDFLPPGNSRGLEVGIASGHFAQALGIKEGVESVQEMAALARKKNLEVMDATPEALPYKDLSFDFVLINFTISYLNQLKPAFKEAYRVLKKGGVLIVGFVDKSSPLGRQYEAERDENPFYRHANFYEPKTVINHLEAAGFENLKTAQTIFQPLDQITETEIAKPGLGEGSYVIIAAYK